MRATEPSGRSVSAGPEQQADLSVSDREEPVAHGRGNQCGGDGFGRARHRSRSWPKELEHPVRGDPAGDRSRRWWRPQALAAWAQTRVVPCANAPPDPRPRSARASRNAGRHDRLGESLGTGPGISAWRRLNAAARHARRHGRTRRSLTQAHGRWQAARAAAFTGTRDQAVIAGPSASTMPVISRSGAATESCRGSRPLRSVTRLARYEDRATLGWRASVSGAGFPRRDRRTRRNSGAQARLRSSRKWTWRRADRAAARHPVHG